MVSEVESRGEGVWHHELACAETTEPFEACPVGGVGVVILGEGAG